MRQRTNPWPSFVDLFSSLLIATFAGMVMITSAYEHELKGYQTRDREMSKLRAEADNIIGQVKQALEANLEVKDITRKCGDDTCIDLFIHFTENDDKIPASAELDTLKRTCTTLKQALDGLSEERRKDIEIIIEGHTDNTQPKNVTGERANYLFNWNLSATRATSVAYEFQQCGLNPSAYQIVAIGYADSAPLCSEATLKCLSLNRRTTLRLRSDTKRIEKRLKDQT